MTKTGKCKDCGGAQTNHVLAKFGAIMNKLRMMKLPPLEWTRKLVLHRLNEQTDVLALIFMRVLIFVGLGKMLSEPDEKTPGRGKMAWEKAKERGIVVKEFRVCGRPVETYTAEWQGKKILFEGLPRPEGKQSEALDWMDSKAEMRKQFSGAGIPIAKGGEAKTFAQALEIFNRVEKPVIIKPHVGSRSRHTTVHIKTESELLSAYKIAKKLSPWVIVEQELQGRQFRATVVGGKVTAVIRRDPAYVMSDGVHTVKQLTDTENKNPKRQGPIYHHLPTDVEAKKELSRQGLDWNSTPVKGIFVDLGQKASRSVGGSTTDVTDDVHEENIALFEKVGKFLAEPLVGIDFIISDISKPWHTQKACGVIECNSLPFIDLHKDPLVGETRDIAGPLWKVVFPTA